MNNPATTQASPTGLSNSRADGPIYLIGYMGAGKTTLGAAVAKATAARFVDLDDYIEQQQGMTVSQIFKEKGEAEFRRLETLALRDLAQAPSSGTPDNPSTGTPWTPSRSTSGPPAQPLCTPPRSTSGTPAQRLIVACGGGTPCHNDNMGLMNSTGTTIYLEASLPTLVARLSAERSRRPLIASMSDDELPRFIDQALAQRLPHYTRAMSRFNVDHLDSLPQLNTAVADFIARYLQHPLP